MNVMKKLFLATCCVLLASSSLPGDAALRVLYDLEAGRVIILNMDPPQTGGSRAWVTAYTDTVWVFHHAYTGYTPSANPYGLIFGCAGMTVETITDTGTRLQQDSGCGALSVNIDDISNTFTIDGVVRGSVTNTRIEVHVAGSVSGTPAYSRFLSSGYTYARLIARPAQAQFRVSSPEMGLVSGNFAGLSGIMVGADDEVSCQSPLTGC